MQQPIHALLPAGVHDQVAGPATDVDAFESAAAASALVQDADQVDHRPLAGAERPELALIVDVGCDQLQRRNRAEMCARDSGLRVGTVMRQPVAGERRAQVRAHESGPAKHADRPGCHRAIIGPLSLALAHAGRGWLARPAGSGGGGSLQTLPEL